MKEVVQMVMDDEVAEQVQPTFIKTRKGRRPKNATPQKSSSPSKARKASAKKEELINIEEEDEMVNEDIGMYEDEDMAEDSEDEDDGQPAVTFRYEEDEDTAGNARLVNPC